MAIKSGRVGVRSDQVDVYGRVKGSAQMVLDDIANEYQNDVLYNVGDYVVYNSNLYKCLVANTRALPTDPIYWESVKIGNELSAQFDEIAKQGKKFIDTNNVIARITVPSGNSYTNYTATENCYIHAYLFSSTSLQGIVRINNVAIRRLAPVQADDDCIFLCSKGDVVSVRSTGGNGEITAYGLKS